MVMLLLTYLSMRFLCIMPDRVDVAETLMAKQREDGVRTFLTERSVLRDEAMVATVRAGTDFASHRGQILLDACVRVWTQVLF